MKKLLLLLPVLFFLGCNNDHKLALDEKWFDCDAPSFPPVRGLTTATGEKMEKEYADCEDCPVPTKYEFDINNLKKLKGLLEGGGPKITNLELVPGVYDTEGTKAYTCRVCKGDEKDERCQVKGYQTMLLKMETEDEKYVYFDFATICPPPRGCDRDTTNN